MSITVRNTKKEEFLNVVSVNESTNAAVVDKSYFETSADQVVIDTPIDGVTGGNVAEALGNLATGVSQAGKVDDVQDVNGASIVTNKIAKLTKAAVGLRYADNTADADKSVKHATSADSANSAKKLDKKLNFISKHGSIDNTCWFDGVVDMNLTLDEVDFQSTNMSQTNTRPTTLKVHLAESGVTAGTYNGITVDAKGRVTNAVDGDYATNTDLNKKLDKAGGTVTGALAVNGGLTVGGNLTVNGTTTTVDSTTLQVKDKLIEVAHGNTTKLTTPAGLVAPKYDGTNSGALVFDGDGVASVGDVVLDASGNIDVTQSQLQPLATRTGLVDGNLVKYDGTNQTLVDTGKKVGDLQGKLKAGSHISIGTDGTISATDVATAAQGETADAAKAKADTNATDIANIKNGTTVVPNADHAKSADSATNVTTNINGKAITSIFETNGTTVKEATHAGTAGTATTAGSASTAETANKVANALKFVTQQRDTAGSVTQSFDGSTEQTIQFARNEFCSSESGNGNRTIELATRIVDPSFSSEKTYTAFTATKKGIVTGVGQVFAVIGPNDDIPSNVVIGGFVLRTKA